MYYIIDDEFNEFEGKTIQEVCEKAEQEGYFDSESFEDALKNNTIPIFKGSKVKAKRTSPTYEEVKSVVTKKPVAKKTGAKR